MQCCLLHITLFIVYLITVKDFLTKNVIAKVYKTNYNDFVKVCTNSVKAALQSCSCSIFKKEINDVFLGDFTDNS